MKKNEFYNQRAESLLTIAEGYATNMHTNLTLLKGHIGDVKNFDLERLVTIKKILDESRTKLNTIAVIASPRAKKKD